ncbi:MAG: insulinase family protein [bacterium]
METREYNLNSYKLHILKSDKVKSVHLEIHFRDKVNKDNIHYKSMLTDILTDCSEDYKNRKDVVIRLEELYKAKFYGTTSKLGGIVDNIFVYDFINPEYIKDKKYLEEVLSLPFDMVLRPKVKNKCFDNKIFEVIKTRAIRDVNSINENPVKLSINNALNCMDKDSLTSISVLGSLKKLEETTPEELYTEYKNMINNSYCDVFIIGNVDFDEIHKIITKKFNLSSIKTGKLELNIENKVVSKVKKEVENGPFIQTNLNVICNLDKLTKVEKNSTIQVYNYIFGSGGLSSKLYCKLREENSLCYGVYSLYLKYDNLLIIQVSLDEKNKNKAITLIKDCLKEMEKGKIDIEEFEDAKINLLSSLKMSKDNNVALLSNYIFGIYDALPTIDKRIEDVKNVTMDDIKNLSKKIKINTIYSLKSGGNK